MTAALCRSGQPLGGRHDGGCDEPAMSAEDRDALGLTGDWCEEHGTRLAALALGLKLRKISGRRAEALTVVKPKPQPTAGELQAAFQRRRTEEARQRTSALADDIARFVRGADTYPVRRRDVEAHTGRRGQALTDAVNLAIERGAIVSHSHLGPRRSGYYTPEAAPVDTNSLKAAA